MIDPIPADGGRTPLRSGQLRYETTVVDQTRSTRRKERQRVGINGAAIPFGLDIAHAELGEGVGRPTRGVAVTPVAEVSR